jgi:DUF1365 family protein
MQAADALALYTGRTVHQRRAPFTHGFSYRIAQILIDLDRLDDADAQSRLFSVDRFNLFAFHQKDHGAKDGSSLAAWARARFAERGVELDGGPVKLLCAPRVFGYEFNPLAIHFGYGPDGSLRGVIYEVHNTFGDTHAYVVPAEGAETEDQTAPKRFHVSPFFDVAGDYNFRLMAPSESFSLLIHKKKKEGPDFFASMAMTRRIADSKGFAGLFASQPFSTLKTIAAIHWEALRLVIKGARYHHRPAPPEPGVTLGRTARSRTT